MKKKEEERRRSISNDGKASPVRKPVAPVEPPGQKARMEFLQVKAKEAAIRELQLKLNTPESLTKCALLTVEYERKLECTTTHCRSMNIIYV